MPKFPPLALSQLDIDVHKNWEDMRIESLGAPSDVTDAASLLNSFTVRGVDTKTENYTFVLGDAGKLLIMNNAAVRTFTIPTNANVPFPIGTKIAVMNWNTGVVSIAGVTRMSFNAAYDLAGQYAAALLIKVGTDEWLLEGDVT